MFAVLATADTELEDLNIQMTKMQQQIDVLKNTQKTQTASPVSSPNETSSLPVEESADHSFEHYADSFKQSSFMPDISLIVDMSFVDRNKKDEELQHLEVPGIAHSLIGSHSHGDHGHATYNANNGFNLNYAELAMQSSVDQLFDLNAVFHFTEYSVEIEEAYFTSNSLPNGFRVRGGKFLSEFGRHNNQHHHVWEFADAPLVYHAFLGDHGINEKGVQIQWLAPTSSYLMFGIELLQGENEAMYGTGAITASGDEEVQAASSPSQPNLIIAYAKASVDIEDTTILGGISYATGESRIDHLSDEEAPHAFSADSRLYGVDLSLKHYFDSYRYLAWQSEWLYRDMDGDKYTYATPADDSFNTTALQKKQAGHYTQLVYAHDRNWRAGLRYDDIYKNEINTIENEDDLKRYSIMAEYLPSEFSRIRLQYNVNKALYDEAGKQQDIQSLILQVNLAIGAHAAHSF